MEEKDAQSKVGEMFPGEGGEPATIVRGKLREEGDALASKRARGDGSEKLIQMKRLSTQTMGEDGYYASVGLA